MSESAWLPVTAPPSRWEIEDAAHDAEMRIRPHLVAIMSQLDAVQRAMYPSSDLTIVLPESDWVGVPSFGLPSMLYGCKVLLADVDKPMIAIPA